MKPWGANGKRLLPPDSAPDRAAEVKFLRTTTSSNAGNEDDEIIRLVSLPDDLLCHVLSYLDVKSLLRSRCLTRSFRTIASKSSAGWENLCQTLWINKVHVPKSAREHKDAMAAYRLSVEDARNRDYVTPEELLFDPISKTGTVWSFRFKESAGVDWTSWDPWYNGRPCRKMVFLEDGAVKEYKSATEDGDSSLQDPPFSERTGTLFDPQLSMSWRFITQPLDMPARPRGSYIRFSVAGRDVPTYCVRRSPTKNWGFIMESCWGVYASFELPQRVVSTTRRNARVRIRRAQDTLGNWFNVEVEESEEENEATREADLRHSSRLLVDDDTFTVTSGIQWREAFMYNVGARELPEGENALAEFQRTYILVNR